MSKTIKMSSVAAAVSLAVFAGGVNASSTDFVSAYQAEISNVVSTSVDKSKKPVTRYIVQLEDAPLATYRGEVAGLEATSAAKTGNDKVNLASRAAQQYGAYLAAKQKTTAARITSATGASVTKSFNTLFNGLVVEGKAGQFDTLAALPGVKKVFLDVEFDAAMDASIDVIKGVEAWEKLGGQSEAGKGVKVAIIDSGIRPENPMFSGEGFSAPDFSEAEQAYLTSNPDYCRSVKADFCNNKLIVARHFGPLPSGLHPDEYDSPLGYDAHGTHVAGTAVGNPVNITYSGHNVNLSGVAPGAQLMAYKALWHKTDGRASGTTVALMSALEAAVKDGADVINNSWGGGAGGNPASSAYGELFKSAEEAGVVVVTAAGNDGNGPQTIGCPSCIESGLTVANTQTGRFFSQTATIAGDTYLTREGSNELLDSKIELPVVAAHLVATDNFKACDEFAEDIDFSDKIVLVSRGDCSFVTKAENAAKAGAKAVIIHNNAAGGNMGMSMDDATIPAVSVSLEDGQNIVAKLEAAEEAVIATLDPTVQRVLIDKFVDAVNSSSSRGPNGEPSFLKPDIAAPGTDILSAFSPDEGNGVNFNAITGTSMASPHVAGAAALMKQKHPTWSAVEIKTALMSTSKMDGLHKEDLVTDADAFDVGAGRLDAPAALDAALTFTKGSFADPSCLTNCDFTNMVTNMTDAETKWTAHVVTDMDGAEIEVTPSEFVLKAHGSEGDAAEFSLNIDPTFNTVKGWNFGHVVFTSEAGQVAHLPFAIFDNEANDATVLSANVDADSLNSYTPAKVDVEFKNSVFSGPVKVEVKIDNGAKLLNGAPISAIVDKGEGKLVVDEANNSFVWTGTIAKDGFTLEADDFLGTTSLTQFDGIDPIECSGECDEFNVALNASFKFDGKEYDHFTISDNGLITAGSSSLSTAYAPQTMPDATAPNAVIAPLWADFDLEGGATGGGKIYAGILSNAAGERFYIVEWNKAQLYDGDGTEYTFQVIIKEGTDEIRLNYIDVPKLPADYSAGVESADGNSGIMLSSVPTGTDLGKGYVVGKVVGGSLKIESQFLANNRANWTSADSVTTDEEQTVNVNVLANDKGESRFVLDAKVTSEGDNAEYIAHKGARVKAGLQTSTVTVVDAPAHGTAVVKDDGSIDYTPASQFAGTDSFTYTVKDSSGLASDKTTVSVTVNDTIPDPVIPVVVPNKKSSSGSLFWLLLAAPLALFRRKK